MKKRVSIQGKSASNQRNRVSSRKVKQQSDRQELLHYGGIILAVLIQFTLLAFGEHTHAEWIVQCAVSGVLSGVKKLLEDEHWWNRRPKR